MSTATNLVLEINADCENLTPEIKGPSGSVMFTPPVGEDYWLFRVRLSDSQALIAFPKFSTVGIGFAVEEDWNTNLPASSSAEDIFNHIKHNKGDDSIADETCVQAIEILREHSLKFLQFVYKDKR